MRQLEKASSIIESVLNSIDGPITFGEFMARLQEKGYGLLVIAGSLVVIIPTPPGLNAVSGIIVLIWAIQRLFGNSPPWLPRFIRSKLVSERFLGYMKEKGIPFVKKLERYMPKGSAASSANPFETKAASALVALMALLTAMPTPFLTSIPAAVITLVGLGILYGNRYIIWTSFLAGALAFTIIGNALWIGTDFLIDLF